MWHMDSLRHLLAMYYDLIGASLLDKIYSSLPTSTYAPPLRQGSNNGRLSNTIKATKPKEVSGESLLGALGETTKPPKI